MSTHQTRWDIRSPEELLEEAAHFEQMAKRFDMRPRLRVSFALLAKDAADRASRSAPIGDVDYLRMRAAREQSAALDATDARYTSKWLIDTASASAAACSEISPDRQRSHLALCRSLRRTNEL